MFCCALGGLLADVDLVLELNKAKWVVVKYRRHAREVKWYDIKLLFSW